MTRHQQCGGLDLADLEGLAVLEQMVELASIREKAALEVVELPEDRLNRPYVLADGDAAASLGLYMARARQVVGVRVGFQNPVDLQAVAPNEGSSRSAEAVLVWPD
jgi:hypothetical protein